MGQNLNINLSQQINTHKECPPLFVHAEFKVPTAIIPHVFVSFSVVPK